MHFIDEVRFSVRGGSGGNGCVAFRREKYAPRGGPAGGDGGDGGDVVLEAADDVHGFYDLRGRRELKAKNGRPGQGSNRHGKDAADLVVRVPVGTEVRDAASGVVLKDLVEPGARVRIVREAVRIVEAAEGEGGEASAVRLGTIVGAAAEAVHAARGAAHA